MTYLQAAKLVLEDQGRPLSANRIVEVAFEKGLIEHDVGVCVSSMRARLSEDIAGRCDRSEFMRTHKGLFGLRRWKDRFTEYRAVRPSDAILEEEVVVFPESLRKRFVPVVGLWKEEVTSEALLRTCRGMRRRDAEVTFDFIQLVSVFVVRHGSRFLTHRRTKRLPESRLHGTYSIAFGGHVNPADVEGLFDIFSPVSGLPFILRELQEELVLKSGSIDGIDYLGLLYDDSRTVSRQHLGLVYLVRSATDQVAIGEKGYLTDGRFEGLTEIEARLSDFENWSQILIQSLKVPEK